jgi:hypothetical protein
MFVLQPHHARGMDQQLRAGLDMREARVGIVVLSEE